jgi:1-acyl-sn-glycerol-3-phosphate acyltransferase
MAIFDKDNEPFDADGIASHINEALAVERPDGLWTDVYHQLVNFLYNPVIRGRKRVSDKPCLFVGNHSFLALDGMVLAPILLKDLQRFVRPLGDKFLWSTDVSKKMLMAQGALIGHPEVCSAFMREQRDLLVFPGGAHEAVKPTSQNYTLQWKERYGFVKLAAMHGYTIQPFAMVGPDEFYGHFLEGDEILDTPVAKVLKRMGLINDDIRPDMLPPIPVGALGSWVPKPQRCYVGFGEPIDLSKYEGKKLGKRQRESIRNEVADEIEAQIADLLLLRSQLQNEDGILRRILTI